MLQKHHKPKKGDHYLLLFACVFVDPLDQQCFLDLKKWCYVCIQKWNTIEIVYPSVLGRLNVFSNKYISCIPLRLQFISRHNIILQIFLYLVKHSDLQDVHSLPWHGRVWRVRVRSLQETSCQSGLQESGQGQGQEYRETAIEKEAWEHAKVAKVKPRSIIGMWMKDVQKWVNLFCSGYFILDNDVDPLAAAKQKPGLRRELSMSSLNSGTRDAEDRDRATRLGGGH